MVEGARLESVYTLTRIEGSNPSLSAIIVIKTRRYEFSKTLDTICACSKELIHNQ